MLLNNGKLPYIDVFENKGPLLHYINALGVYLGGRNGVLFLQIFNLWLCLIVWQKTYILIRGKRKGGGLALFASLFYFSYYIIDGNFSEEWSLLSISILLYVLFKYIITNFTYNKKELFTCGICLGMILCIRQNNVAPILVPACYVIGIYIHKYGYKNTIFPVSCVIGGALLVCTFCYSFYFFCEGWDGLKTALYCSFIFNFEYAIKFQRNIPLHHVVLMLLPLAYLVIDTLYEKHRIKESIILSLSIVLTSFCCIGKALYEHYFIIFTVFIPIFFALKAEKKRRVNVLIHIMVLLLFVNGWYPYGRYISAFENRETFVNRETQMKKILSQLTSKDLDSIWNYNSSGLGMGIYSNLEVIQCNRMIFNIDGLRPKILYGDLTRDSIQIKRPKYILYTTFDPDHWYYNQDELSFIQNNYVVKDSTKVKDSHNIILLKRMK